jgi:hypothetical protein
MGILDDAIRDHLELKRRGGAQEADLRRLEDEAFGPPSRPGDAGTAVETKVQAPESLQQASPPADRPAPERVEPEEPAAPRPEGAEEARSAEDAGEEPAGTNGGGLFHDFAAEEGLVGSGAEAPPAPSEEREVAETAPEEPESLEPPTPAPPAEETSFDDTQPHDMEAELSREPEGSEPAPVDEIELEDEDLELELDDEPESTDAGPDLRVVEEEEVELVEEDVEIVEEPGDAGQEGDDEEEEGEDVLEETPDFLRETPEHDRLWFEQRPPKDFDFDE